MSAACKHYNFGLHVYLCYTKTTRLYQCYETFTFCDLGEAVITFSTVGFGDIAPKSKLGRCVGSFFMIFGVASFGHLAAWMNLIPNLFLFLFLSFTQGVQGWECVCLAHGMGSKVCKKAGRSTEQQWTYCAHLYKKIHLCLSEFHIFMHLDSHNVERIRKYKWQWITKCKMASEHAHTHTRHMPTNRHTVQYCTRL